MFVVISKEIVSLSLSLNKNPPITHGFRYHRHRTTPVDNRSFERVFNAAQAPINLTTNPRLSDKLRQIEAPPVTRSSKRVSPRFFRLGVSRFSHGSRTNNFFSPRGGWSLRGTCDFSCDRRGWNTCALSGCWPYIAKCLSRAYVRFALCTCVG